MEIDDEVKQRCGADLDACGLERLRGMFGGCEESKKGTHARAREAQRHSGRKIEIRMEPARQHQGSVFRRARSRGYNPLEFRSTHRQTVAALFVTSSTGFAQLSVRTFVLFAGKQNTPPRHSIKRERRAGCVSACQRGAMQSRLFAIRLSLDFFELNTETIDVGESRRRVVPREVGATVTLDGYAREWAAGRKTLYLVTSLDSMALTEMQRLGRDAHKRFEIAHVGIVHRPAAWSLVKRAW